LSIFKGHVEVVRVLLAAGADKHYVSGSGLTATYIATTGVNFSKPDKRAAILALLAAAP